MNSLPTTNLVRVVAFRTFCVGFHLSSSCFFFDSCAVFQPRFLSVLETVDKGFNSTRPDLDVRTFDDGVSRQAGMSPVLGEARVQEGVGTIWRSFSLAAQR